MIYNILSLQMHHHIKIVHSNMSKTNLPIDPNTTKVYFQNNRTNVYPIGTFWSTFNVDLQTNLGVLRISPRLKLNTSTSDDADFGLPVAIKYFDTKIWAICDTHIFSNAGEPDDAFVDDASTGFQTNYNKSYSDLCIFNGTLCSSTETGIYSKAADGAGTGTWTLRDTLTSSSTLALMTHFRRLNRLYYSNALVKIHSMDTAWTVADPTADYTLTLNSSEDVINALQSTTNFVWIGCINNLGKTTGGAVYNWDGLSAQPTSQFKLQAQGVAAMCILDDNPVILDTNGVLSQYTGYTFEEIGRLPFGDVLPYASSQRYIHPNGMYATKNKTIRMLINNRANSGSVIENLPSGVWEWSKEKGVVHIGSLSYNPIASSTITDFGQNRVSLTGALVPMQLGSSAVDGTYMAGATIYTDASSSKSGIFFDNSKDDVQKKGYFVSTWLQSDEMADAWDELWLSFRKFLNANDNIVCKYRIAEVAPVEGSITWVNTTSFTILNSAVVVSDYWTSGTGGEVEILRGTGGGCTAHITNAVNNAGTWTVTIDEAATGVTTGTATARFQKWIKVYPAEALSSTSTWADFSINTDSTPRIQIKVCFTYTGQGEFYKAIIQSNEDITSKQ